MLGGRREIEWSKIMEDEVAVFYLLDRKKNGYIHVF